MPKNHKPGRQICKARAELKFTRCRCRPMAARPRRRPGAEQLPLNAAVAPAVAGIVVIEVTSIRGHMAALPFAVPEMRIGAARVGDEPVARHRSAEAGAVAGGERRSSASSSSTAGRTALHHSRSPGAGAASHTFKRRTSCSLRHDVLWCHCAQADEVFAAQ
jgi:hypothetical protein